MVDGGSSIGKAKSRTRYILIAVAIAAAVALAAIFYVYIGQSKPKLILATTTSVYDSGLLDVILPDFESEYGIEVHVLAVGSGQALAYGRSGDADLLLVHSPKDETDFVDQGYGLYRKTLLWNTYLIVGPQGSNPAGLDSTDNASTAFQKINNTGSRFVSRADDSGTNKKELGIWSSLNIPRSQLNDSSWYTRLGQGMGETLAFTNEQQVYTLTDEGTWYKMESNLGNLNVYVDNDTALLNYYSVIPVNNTLHPNVNNDAAVKFVTWLSSDSTLDMVEDYAVNGHLLFKKY